MYCTLTCNVAIALIDKQRSRDFANAGNASSKIHPRYEHLTCQVPSIYALYLCKYLTCEDSDLERMQTNWKKEGGEVTFKLLKGKENIDYKHCFQRDQNIHGLSRGNDMKLFVPAVRTEMRKNFVSHRVLKAWNSLPQQ
jgi:hypothetical protein